MENSYIKAVIDCDTNEIKHLPMTDAEITEFKKSQEEAAKQEALREQEAALKQELMDSAKAKLVAGEPLTEEEAATLII